MKRIVENLEQSSPKDRKRVILTRENLFPAFRDANRQDLELHHFNWGVPELAAADLVMFDDGHYQKVFKTRQEGISKWVEGFMPEAYGIEGEICIDIDDVDNGHIVGVEYVSGKRGIVLKIPENRYIVASIRNNFPESIIYPSIRKALEGRDVKGGWTFDSQKEISNWLLSKKGEKRVEFRVSNEEKELFEYAKELKGFKTLSEFARFIITREAKAIVKEENKILAAD